MAIVCDGVAMDRRLRPGGEPELCWHGMRIDARDHGRRPVPSAAAEIPDLDLLFVYRLSRWRCAPIHRTDPRRQGANSQLRDQGLIATQPLPGPPTSAAPLPLVVVGAGDPVDLSNLPLRISAGYAVCEVSTRCQGDRTASRSRRSRALWASIGRYRHVPDQRSLVGETDGDGANQSPNGCSRTYWKTRSRTC
jgi:hypothetical protein